MSTLQQNSLPLSDFIDRILIIDDSKEDAESLAEEMAKIEVLCEWFTPEQLQEVKLKKNRQLIFCDLHMWNHLSSPAERSSAIRRMLQDSIGEEFGAYGLILWTEHKDEVEDLTIRLSHDRKGHIYNTPIFVLSISKLPYKEDGFGNLLIDLSSKIEAAISARFYVSWGNMVKTGFNNTISSLYERTKDYGQQDPTMQSLFSVMALNQIGLPEGEVKAYPFFSDDTYKSMSGMLSAGLFSNSINRYDLYNGNFSIPSFADRQEELLLYSFLNSKLFLCPGNLNQEQIFPGNVYQIKNANCDYMKLEGSPKISTPILVELTPPCDYSHKKVGSRLVSGFMVECPIDNDKLHKWINNSFAGDFRYKIWPIDINGMCSFVCFDFRHLYYINDEDLKDSTKYELKFRLAQSLFADVLQKFSSHAARLGESVLKPKLLKPIIEGDAYLKDERILIDRLKKKLEEGLVTTDDFRSIAKSRGFDIDKDKVYLSALFERNGLQITADGVLIKQ